MLSRVAEDVYWMARYIERAENTARIVNVNANLVLDLPRNLSPGWRPLTVITGSEALFQELYEDFDERSVVKFLVGDLRNPGSILASLYFARENVRTIRDIVPRETWEHINDIYLYAKEHLKKGLSKSGRYEYLRYIIFCAQQITGMLAGTMSHGPGYDFIRMGRNLERADMTTRIIDVRSASLLPEQDGKLTPYGNIQWMSVLKSLTAYQMYRRHMQVRVARPQVLQFLLQDRQFPRAFYHCICEVETCLRHLPHNEQPLRVLASTQRRVLDADVAVLKQEELHRFIDELQLGLTTLDEHIEATYFHARPAQAQAG